MLTSVSISFNQPSATHSAGIKLYSAGTMMVAGCEVTAVPFHPRRFRSIDAFQRYARRLAVGTGYARGFHACFDCLLPPASINMTSEIEQLTHQPSAFKNWRGLR